MVDLALNEDAEVFIDSTGDLGTVDGRDAFEQKIAVSLMALNHQIIGEEDRDTAIELTKISARRVAESMDKVDSIASIDAEFSSDKPNTIELTILYDTGEELTFDIN